MDILDEARLAVFVARSGGSAIGAHGALELATIGGARALGLTTEIGSLEPGKSADLAAFRVDSARDEPVYDPATVLVFGTGGRRALMVAVAGQELVRDGRLLASLEPDIAAARGIGERLADFALEAGARDGLDFSVVPPPV
jgi:5-methylthioadenosine/S-adenosylhomocysteine deaminase